MLITHRTQYHPANFNNHPFASPVMSNPKPQASSPPQQLAKRVLELLRYDMIIAIGIAVLLFVAGLGVDRYYLQRPIVEVKPLPYAIDCANLSIPQLERVEAMVTQLNDRAGKVECVTELPFKYIQAPHSTVHHALSLGALVVQADSLISDGKGSSMIPTFFEGNTLIVEKYRSQQLKAGMIVSYHDDVGEKLVHRISSVYPDEIVVKGDANNVADASIRKEQVEGIVIGVLYT